MANKVVCVCMCVCVIHEVGLASRVCGGKDLCNRWVTARSEGGEVMDDGNVQNDNEVACLQWAACEGDRVGCLNDSHSSLPLQCSVQLLTSWRLKYLIDFQQFNQAISSFLFRQQRFCVYI